MSELGAEYTPAEARIDRIFDRLKTQIGAIIMTSAESAASAAADKLDKGYGEVVNQVAELNAVIEELRDQSVDDATINRLQAVADKFDALNPDQPA